VHAVEIADRHHGAGERFGEDRLRAELGGARDPTEVVGRIEGSLQAFTEGEIDDDVAMLVLAPGAYATSRRPTAIPNIEVAHG